MRSGDRCRGPGSGILNRSGQLNRGKYRNCQSVNLLGRLQDRVEESFAGNHYTHGAKRCLDTLFIHLRTQVALDKIACRAFGY